MSNVQALLTIATEAQVLVNHQRCSVTVTLTNTGDDVMKDIVVSTHGGLDVTVIPRSIHKDHLGPRASCELAFEVEALGVAEEAEEIAVPVTVRWRNALGRAQRVRTVLNLRVATMAPVALPSRFRALIIGVDGYRDPRILSRTTSSRDAEALAGTLTEDPTCGYHRDRLKLLADRGVTVARFQMQLADLAATTARDETTLIYVSAHAFRIQERGRWRSYLCLEDTAVDMPAATALSVEAFTELLLRVPTDRGLVILDTCRAETPSRLKTLGGYLQLALGWTPSDLAALCAATGYVFMSFDHPSGLGFSNGAGDISQPMRYLLDTLKGQGTRHPRGIYVRDVFAYVDKALRSSRSSESAALRRPHPEVDFPIAMVSAKGRLGSGG